MTEYKVEYFYKKRTCYEVLITYVNAYSVQNAIDLVSKPGIVVICAVLNG